jgi:hypothetical protein
MKTLQEEALLSQKHPTKLVAPMYAPGKPVSSKAGLLLQLEVSLGFMFGALYASGRAWLRRAA